ncbi:biotin-independent malonate decarboxylase subunit beta [Paenibacillus kyungheensis]|uniref:Biotin-independent malonate decarboxylase subunit beta n=1 Tax=Paenibacillus kyungheensis TaxID=1452732 RepID=A0AAX3LY88_9BACL|nr:biotin-independent malonate decarboxylase subunit beta [Paenibacillus kyungheensis]WCT54807.1 biotin-independent malonate decarboxylase subunit beta [Paenibacillus kyungheensis]
MNNNTQPIEIANASFIELSGRERAQAVLDQGSFRELIGPFDRITSPHLPLQGIVAQSDDGVIVGRGTIDGEPAVAIALEGAFQGGGIGEVCGAKISGALEQVLLDHQKGIKTRPVLLLETGGVRLQEGNYGLLAIAEIGAAIMALRPYTPVVSVISGMIGCYGGMSICAAGLSSHLIMTRQGRLQLNGSEVIEQEAGIQEMDASDRSRIWSMVGGEQRVGAGFADALVNDDVQEINQAIHDVFRQGIKEVTRTAQVERYLELLAAVDADTLIVPSSIRESWKSGTVDQEALQQQQARAEQVQVNSSEAPITRGRTWFEALSGRSASDQQGIASVLCADTSLEGQSVRYISVVPNPNARFVRARQGEIGLEEGWNIARYIREAIEADQDGEKRAIVAIVDVPSQAYGYREEVLGIHLSCGSAVDAYASARLAGHPVIALIVGNAISGAFLAHGMQANRLLALDDEKVTVQVMSKQSAARITRRSIDQLNEAATKVPGAAYDIRSFAKLGALDQLIEGIEADQPQSEDIERIHQYLMTAITDARQGSRDLSNRLTSATAATGRASSIKVRQLLAEQWD